MNFGFCRGQDSFKLQFMSNKLPRKQRRKKNGKERKKKKEEKTKGGK